MKLRISLVGIFFLTLGILQCKKQRLKDPELPQQESAQENLTETDINKIIKDMSSIKKDIIITEDTFKGSFSVEINQDKQEYPYPCLSFDVNKTITHIDYVICDKNKESSCNEKTNESKGSFFPIFDQNQKVTRCVPSVYEGAKIAKVRFCVDASQFNKCSDWMSHNFDQPQIEGLELQALDIERERLEQAIFSKGNDIVSILKAYQGDVQALVKEESSDPQTTEKKKALEVIVSNDIELGPSIIGDFLIRNNWSQDEQELSQLNLFPTSHVYYGSPVTYHRYVEKPRGNSFSGDEDEKAKYRCFYNRGHESFSSHMQLSFSQYFKIYLSNAGISSLPAEKIVGSYFGPLSTSQYLQSNYSEILAKIENVEQLFELKNIQVGLINSILSYQAPQLGKVKITSLTKLFLEDSSKFNIEIQAINMPVAARSSIQNLARMDLSLLDKECGSVKQSETSKMGSRLLVVGVIGGVVSVIGLMIGDTFDDFRYWTKNTTTTERAVTTYTSKGAVTESIATANDGYKFSKLSKVSAVVLGVSLVVGITGALMYNYGLTEESRSKASQAVENMTMELDKIASEASFQKEELTEAIEKIRQKS